MSGSTNIRREFSFLSSNPASTFSFGKRLGEKMEAGSIIALIGELGCGKTLFTRGICVGLGVPERAVNSPTFAFVNEYQGRLHIFHVDLYRVDDLTEEFGIGMLDYIARAGSGVVVLEWAEKALPLLPDDHLQVRFEVISARKRQLRLTSFGTKFGKLLRELGEK